jgi:hypothetical protein
MAQLSDDCFAFGGAMLSLDEAERHLRAAHDCAVSAIAARPTRRSTATRSATPT